MKYQIYQQWPRSLNPNRRLAITTILAFAVMPMACGIEGEIREETTANKRVMNSYLENLDQLPDEPSALKAGEKSATEIDSNYSCYTQSFSETRQYERLSGFAVNSESLWPGAIISGAAVQSGVFTQVVVPRLPLTFSVSLENLAGPKSATMESPSLSCYREEFSKIIQAEITGATPANTYFEIEQVHSKNQLGLVLGVEVQWNSIGPSAAFNFDNSDIKSRYLVKYTQGYYTVDVDQPGQASDWISSKLSLADLKRTFKQYDPPLYVSSITYGRAVLFAFESNSTSTDLGTAIKFAYNNPSVSVSAELEAKYKNIIENSTVTAYILGGSGGMAAQTIDSYEALQEYIHSGGDYSRESPGAPIAYKLAHLADNSPARLSFTGDYITRTCHLVSEKVIVRAKAIKVVDKGGDAGEDLEIYGKVMVSSTDQDNTDIDSKILWETDINNRVAIKEGKAYPDDAYLGESILKVAPQDEAKINIHVQLHDHDTDLIHQSLGDVTVSRMFEQGWLGQVPVHLTGDGTKVTVMVELEPLNP
jgi:thiol-activated cytolysin